MNRNALLFVLVGICVTAYVESLDCSGGVLLYGCTCFDDGDADMTTWNLRCTNVASGADLANVFVALNCSSNTFTNVKVENSPLITSLPNDLFGQCTVNEFEMSGTSVTTVDSAAFGSSSTLTKLYLKANPELMTVMADVVSNMPMLDSLYVSECPKVTQLLGQLDTSTDATTYLDLSSNAITMVDVDYFSALKGLKYLSLGRNSMTEVPAGMLHIVSHEMYIDLSNNMLSNGLNISAFDGGIHKPKQVILSGNQIVYLTEEVYMPLMEGMFGHYGTTVDVYVLLNDNPLDCTDCSMQWFPSYANKDILQGAVCVGGELVANLTPANFSGCP